MLHIQKHCHHLAVLFLSAGFVFLLLWPARGRCQSNSGDPLEDYLRKFAEQGSAFGPSNYLPSGYLPFGYLPSDYLPLDHPYSDWPGYGSARDYRSGNIYNWDESGGTTYLRGYNMFNGSRWRSTYNQDGSASGWDADGHYWSLNPNGTYRNYGTGQVCYGKGYARVCY